MSTCQSCSEFASNNLGGYSNQVAFGSPFKRILVPTFGSDGTRNHIPKSALPLTEEYLNGKINAVNPKDRWYLTPEIHTPTDERATPNFLEGSNNERIVTSEGRREVTEQYWFGGSKLKQKLDAFFCQEMSYFVIDNCNNLQGEEGIGNADKLFPVTIAKGTAYTILVKNTGADTREHVLFAFDVDRRSQDAKLLAIAAKNIALDLRYEEGLIDVIVVGTPTASVNSLTISLGTPYGNFGQNVPLIGLVAADVTLTNLTTATPVAIDSLVETNGSYVINFVDDQTIADIIIPTFERNGFDFKSVNALEVVVA